MKQYVIVGRSDCMYCSRAVGLIRDKGGDLFVHLRAVQPEDRRKLKENTKVRFSVENSEKGPQAENIRII